MANSPMVLQVFVFKEGEFVGSDNFTSERIVIGRDSDVVDLPLMSGHVSRQHAALTHHGNVVTLEDLDSKNGIYVNNEKIKRAEVTSRDKLTIGDFTLKIKLVSSAPTRASSPQRSNGPTGRQSPTPKTTMPGNFTHEMTPANASSVMQSGVMPMDAGRTGAEHQLLDAFSPSPEGDINGMARPVEDITPDVLSPPMHDPLLHGDEEDEHDDEEHFHAPYSLVDHVLRSPSGDTSALAQPCVEVMTVVGDRVADFSLVNNRQTWRRYSPSARKVANDSVVGLRSVHCRADGGCTVECDEDISGGLRRGHQDMDAARFFSHRGPDGCRGVLVPGDLLSLQSSHATFYLRYVTPAPVPVDTRSFLRRVTMDGQILNVFLASLLVHLAIGVAVSLLAPEDAPAEKTPEFVVQTKKDMTLQEPKPPPKPPKPPKPPEPPKPPAPPSKPERHAKRPRSHARPTKVAKATAPKPVSLPPNPAPPGILGLLSKKGATQAPGPVAAVQAVSNLAAVKTPGNSGSYRVSGLIGKLPTSSGISTGGGGGGVVTKGGAALLRGGGGAGRLSDQGNRNVGAMVQKGSRSMRTGGGGSLDRALIEKVVNEHTDEIQRCYERELAKDASLQGKVEVEWVIGLDGSVTSDRQKSSSVRSVGLARCMLDAIHTWRFPHPQGGSVVVTFPFSFKGVDF